MNKIDFDTNPAGFPLESDAILGFMQQGLIDAILGVARVCYDGHCIVSGVVKSGSTYSSGWVIYSNELYYFQGGTEQSTCVVVENVTSKNNQNGTPVNRIFERYVAFGGGGGSFAFASFKRINLLSDTQLGLRYIANFADGFGASNDWVVLSEFTPNGSGLNAGAAMYNGEVVMPGAYSVHLPTAGNPVYLTPNGEWTTTSAASYLKFDPYTENIQERLSRNAIHPLGSILWIKTGSSVLSAWFTAGLGKWKWLDWAIADGTNGTLNLSSAITGLTAVQRIA